MNTQQARLRPFWNPDLGLSASRTVTDKFLWFKPPRLRDFVMAVLAD